VSQSPDRPAENVSPQPAPSGLRQTQTWPVSVQIEAWLARCPDPAAGIHQAGLNEPAPDYATVARVKAALVERTGLPGIAGVWGGRQLVGRHFLSFANDFQRAASLGRALAVAISEPKVGAHPKLLTTRADAVEGGFRITGRKAWVTNGPSADAIIVFAITAQEAGRKRYSAFIVPRDTPGLTIEAMPEFHALRPSQHCLLTLDSCFVPASAQLGDPGSAYDRMALPFRDIEDAVGSFATLGALRHAIGLLAAVASVPAEDLGAIAALTAVFAAGADAVVAALDAGQLKTGDATLVGLRVLAIDIVSRLRAAAGTSATQRLAECLADMDATLAIASGPRLARQSHLGETARRTAKPAS
jgi:acyl-CoA dehydrogenase